MSRATRRLCMGLAIAGCVAANSALADEQAGPLIQMAILLDTSSSMSGLINQAKSELWTIVNEFVMAKKGGERPQLEVALYEYGKRTIPAGEGHIRMILPLTTDLDKVSEELFALTTNGGAEYCGMVIQAATRGLAWSDSNAALKTVFIAGNEPFTQGSVDYREACKAAIAKGIVVNTIHCGSHEQGLSGKWQDGALLADGKYMNIDHNRKVVHIKAPQDEEIAKLGAELNETYIPYGATGKAGATNQQVQDSNAASVAAEVMVQRALTKASGLYVNTGWDLVDATKNGKVRVEELKNDALPEEMRKMNVQEREAYVEARAKQRHAIQQRINELNQQRKRHVAEEMKKRQQSGEETLDSAIIRAVREQAAKRQFTFE